ncbi:MAG: preprotein translocase subunit YajC [Caldicoprobacterales bacterium]|jgi:preprotein translocase subunit YajC|nr:preprotein translocase subunit YajC [Clostridiales bacterium]
MLLAAQTAAGAEGAGGFGLIIAQIAPFLLMIVVMYFLIIRPQRKRDKENKEMLASLKVGDNVTTIGGVCGKIVNIRDDVLTLEVGKDKVKLVFERWAIRDVDRPISD